MTRPASQPRDHRDDWTWLVGSWSVRHRRLRHRLADCDDWEVFPGTCVNWSVMEGQGNVDDNVLALPSGTYRAVALRTFDAVTGRWSIWWLDARTSVMDPPVQGGFENGVGTFIGEDVFEGRPIKVRFQWSGIHGPSPRWEQAFSADGGASWEINWEMDFTRAG